MAELTGTYAPVAALGPATVVGVCCVLGVAATGTAQHRRDWPGACAPLLTRLRHRHDPQPPPLAQVSDIRLPLTSAEPGQRDGRTPGMSGRSTAAPCALVFPRPRAPQPEGGAVSATNGYRGRAGAAVAAARPVVLVRYRPGVVGETARTVHVVPLPTDEQAGAASALCGAALTLDDIETVTPGVGMPCTVCVVNQALRTAPTGKPPADSPDCTGPGLATGGVTYQNWGWPVTRHRDQVWLSLHRDLSALAIPILLCTAVTEILTARHCAPPVLAHPYAPEHHIVLTGERDGITLPWPGQVHQVTGILLLPPTVTPRGPISWTHPPRENSLQLCREIDLFGALRTALRFPTRELTTYQ